MKFNAYFNEKFLSSEEYVKVSIEIEDNNGALVGMFAAIVNPRTGKYQVQRYLYTGGRNLFNIFGRNKVYTFPLDAFKYKWENYSDEMKRFFSVCISELPRSFYRFHELWKCTDAEYREVCDYLNTLRPETWQNTVNETVNETITENWTEINLNDISSSDLQVIVDEIGKAGNPADGIEFNGNKYRITENQSGLMAVEILKKGAENNPVDNSSVVAPENENTRKFVQMVKMIDVSGLTEFVSGNFYPVADRINRNGKDYFSIKLNDTESRVVSANRVKLVNVFTENPA